MQKTPQKQRTASIAAAMVLAVAAGACGAPSKSESSKSDSDVGPLAAIASAVASDLGTASDSVMRKLGFGPPDGPTAKEVPAASPPPTKAIRRRTPGPKPIPAAVSPVVPAPLAIETPPIAVEEPAAGTPVAEAPNEIAPVVYEPPVVDDSIYTAADLDVAVPILRSQDLPRWRSSDGTDVDAVEVVVSQEGSVERIRLVSRPRRMIDMMALSAAKMWRFDPALKNGAPVRYRIVLASPSTTYER